MSTELDQIRQHHQPASVAPRRVNPGDILKWMVVAFLGGIMLVCMTTCVACTAVVASGAAAAAAAAEKAKQ
jgi:methionine aminopeptidase